MRWTASDLPDQTGRTVVVTGATSGLGAATADAFVRAGARVVLAVRNTERGDALATRLAQHASGSAVSSELELTDLDSVRRFADRWEGPLDVLVNNAGVMAIPLGRNAAGHELQLATNHLGHFALTNLLLPAITDRVVTVSSGLHRGAGFDLSDLNWERRRYQPWRAYSQTKLANLLFTLELERRLTAAGSDVRALAAHPGYAATNLQGGTGNPVAKVAMAVANRVVAQSAEMGALPTLYAATQDLPGGSYLGPDGRAEGRGYPTLVGRSSAASDPALAARLWERSEELTGVHWPELG